VNNEAFGVGIVDTLIGFPTDPETLYGEMRKSFRDKESQEDLEMPAGYMFHDVPDHAIDSSDPIAVTLDAMDRNGVQVGLFSASLDRALAARAIAEQPDRFVPSWTCDPNQGMEGIRELVQAHEELGVRAATVFPAGLRPQVALDAPQMYPIYAKCVELAIPVFVTVGVAGPRVPSVSVQHVERIDQVMYDFPDLVFVMRHGAEPWVDLAVKLMVKWPNLYYSTTAFAPRYYPQAIIDYANTRGGHKVMYGGYFPMGLKLERIMSEMRELPLNDDVVPKFLRNNAASVLGLTLEA
jgi:uncharacterized protein